MSRARAEELPDPARLLRRVRPWRALDDAGFERLVGALRPRHASRGEALFSRGDPFEELFIVASGRFKVGLTGRDGREQILSIATAGTAIAEAPLDEPAAAARYAVSATALDDGHAWALARPELDALLARNTAFARAFLDVVARRVHALIDLVEGLSLRGVPERLAAFLLAHARREHAREGTPFSIVRSLAVETVAGRLGTVREEVQRALRLLADEEIIALSRREIVVLDLERLQRASWEPTP
jgi:CRP/FNR family transcriptional regulator